MSYIVEGIDKHAKVCYDVPIMRSREVASHHSHKVEITGAIPVSATKIGGCPNHPLVTLIRGERNENLQ